MTSKQKFGLDLVPKLNPDQDPDPELPEKLDRDLKKIIWEPKHCHQEGNIHQEEEEENIQEGEEENNYEEEENNYEEEENNYEEEVENEEQNSSKATVQGTK